jgi:Uncharacterized protein conserved in bacteria (DUF2213)
MHRLSKQSATHNDDAGRWVTIGGHHLFIKGKAASTPQESTTEKVVKGSLGLAAGVGTTLASEQIGQYTGSLLGGAVGSIFGPGGTVVGAGAGGFLGGATGAALAGYGATQASEALGGHSAATGAAIGSVAAGIGKAALTGAKGLAHIREAKSLDKALRGAKYLQGAKHVGHGLLEGTGEALGAAGMVEELPADQKRNLKRIIARRHISNALLNEITLNYSATFNFSGNVKRITKNGREYLVAPLTMIVPGILNGSKGPLLYRERDISRNVSAWNGVPLTVQHPSINGTPVSAKANGVWDKQGIGVVKNAAYKGKLVAEGWFDAKRTKKISPTTYNALVNGQPIELSTGLFTENVPVKNGATHKGQSYTHIATNFKPDHLAILPDRKGACSISDGCGVMVNQRYSKLRQIVDTYITHNDWTDFDEARKASKLADFVSHRVNSHLPNQQSSAGHSQAAFHHDMAKYAHKRALKQSGSDKELHNKMIAYHEGRASYHNAKFDEARKAEDTGHTNNHIVKLKLLVNDWAKWNLEHPKPKTGRVGATAPDPVKQTQSRIAGAIASDLGKKAVHPAVAARQASAKAMKSGSEADHTAAAKAHVEAARHYFGKSGDHPEGIVSERYGNKAMDHLKKSVDHSRAAKAAMPFYRRIFNEQTQNHIVKLKSGKYRLLSHKGKNLGTFDSHDAAAKHEGQVEYFKANAAECPECGRALPKDGKCICGYTTNHLQQIVNDWAAWDATHKGGSDSDMSKRFGGDGGPEPASPMAAKAFKASEYANSKGTAKAHLAAAQAHEAAYHENHGAIHLQQSTAHRQYAQSIPPGRGVIDRGIGAVHGAESGGVHGAVAGTVIGGALGAVKGYKRFGKLGAVAGGAEGAWHGLTKGLKAGAGIGGAYGALHNEQVKKLKRICTERS